jgi:hypothetical protein
MQGSIKVTKDHKVQYISPAIPRSVFMSD